jgi:alpha-mannosidase
MLTIRTEIREIWHEMMLGQFHDCLPGTTIKAVVEDNLEIYSRRSDEAQKLLDSALAVLRTQKEGETVVDPLRLAREEIYETSPGQYSWTKTDSAGIGALSALPSDATLPSASSSGDTYRLSNDRYTITLSSKRIVSIYDKVAGREIIAPGVGTSSAGFMIYEDYPLTYDAWDAEIYHLQMGKEIEFDSVEIKEEGGARASLVASAKFGKSSAKLIVSWTIRTCGDKAHVIDFAGRYHP